MATISEQEAQQLEGQVVWPHAFLNTVLERSKELKTDFADLYRQVFQSLLELELDIAIPDLPLVRDQASANDEMLAQPQKDLPLSIVVTTRNDNHSHRMQERTQSFIDNICYLSEKTETPVELVVVEWNPPKDRPPLREGFRFPADHAFLSVVIITVGEDTHKCYDMAAETPLYQMIAKNVGIRRARGAFILATNIDVLFSENVFRAMTDAALQKGRLYRSHRCDVNNDILDITDAEQVLSLVDGKALRTHFQEGPIAPGEARRPIKSLYDTFTPKELAWAIGDDHHKVKVIGAFHRVGWQSLPNLHYQQCGDFQLMHRDDWQTVRGYAELDGFIFHLDSLLSIICMHSGISEHVFDEDCLHYHIDHKMGIEVKPGKYESGSGKRLTHLSVYELWGLERYMTEKNSALVCNSSDWGCLKGDVTCEQVTTPAWLNGSADVMAEQSNQHQKACLLSPDRVVGSNDHILERYMEAARGAHLSFIDFINTNFAGRNIWIWGNGGRGKYLHYLLEKNGLSVKGFCSNSNEGQTCFQELPLKVGADGIDPNNSLVLIASVFAEEIRLDLLEAGFEEGVSFLISP